MARIKPTSTQNERVMREGDFIVSKTDPTGKILYGNRIFIEFSGYSEAELIGQQHNIIRHPDMPRAVFNLLWDTVKTGEEIFAYVKNMAKDGSFYWVFANVTATLDRDGNIVGYYSVRRKPSSDAINTIAPIYDLLVAEETKRRPKAGLAASTKLLTNYLQERGVGYGEFVLGI